MRPLASVILAAALVSGAAVVATAPGVAAATRDAVSDFNNDGYSDLVVSSPTDLPSSGSGSGGFYVVPGSANGIAPSKSKYFTFPDLLVGVVTTSGDFNGDGFDDLAVTSEPGYSEGSSGWVGAVRILYGSGSGLTKNGLQLVQPGSGAIPDGTRYFGEALTAGDYDGDGFDDLAISASGTIWVFAGTDAGLSTPDPVAFTGAGTALASGDLNGDGFDDLAVAGTGPGYLTILPGSADGLTTTGRQEFSISDVQQDGTGLAPATLVIGDFGRTGEDDIAIGTVVGTNVSVLYGTDKGLDVDSLQRWNKTTLSGISGVAQDHGRFGYSLAAGDFGYSTYDDLAIGAFQERVKGATEAGSVTVIVGTANGLVATHGKRWTQDTTGVSGLSEQNDWFGHNLKAGLFNRSSKAGLAISAPHEAIGTKLQAGGVNVLYGSGTALTTTGNSFLTQDTPGMTGFVEAEDWMGWSGALEGEEHH